MDYGFEYGNPDYEAEINSAYRAIADHARAITFLLAEGLRPGNTDREYVLRRLIAQGSPTGPGQVFMRSLSLLTYGRVIDAMGDAYPEIRRESQHIKQAVTGEEERFLETLDRGLLVFFPRRVPSRRRSVLPGEAAFKLYDTYGFPLDLTQEICERRE